MGAEHHHAAGGAEPRHVGGNKAEKTRIDQIDRPCAAWVAETPSGAQDDANHPLASAEPTEGGDFEKSLSAAA